MFAIMPDIWFLDPYASTNIDAGVAGQPFEAVQIHRIIHQPVTENIGNWQSIHD